MTGYWWTHKDAARVMNRAAARRYELDDAERAHLRATMMQLLTGPLPLDPEDARALRAWLYWFEAEERAS
jgi:hypothetical protein